MNLKIELSIWQGMYIKSLPIHVSQKILVDDDDELRIQLKLVPTYDFYQELLTHAERIKDIKPKKIKNQYIKYLQIALNRLMP